MIKQFKRNQFNREVTEDLFHNLSNKVKNFHYVQVLAEKFADFLLFDCTQDVILKAHRSDRLASSHQYQELTTALDFDYWRSRDLLNILVKILSIAVDFSITRHRYARMILEDLCFYKQYLDSSPVTPPEVYNQFNFQGNSLLLSRILEEEENPLSRQRRSSNEVEKQTQFHNIVISLVNFFKSADPILTSIANRLMKMEREEDDTNPPKVERAAALLEGIMWLLKHTVDNYRGKYNSEIASVAKAGVACANILLRAKVVKFGRQNYERLSEHSRSKAAILERWRFFIQSSIDSNTISLLPLNKMKPPQDVEIYILGNGVKEAQRQPVGSPFLDLSQQLLRSVPSYSQAEVQDPYRFQQRLTVKLKTLPRMPHSFRTARRESVIFGDSTVELKDSQLRSETEEWEFLKFPQDMGLRDYKFLLMFLAQRFNEFCFQ